MPAAVMHGEIVAGVIHDPVCQDSAHTLKGQGAWLSHNRRPPLRLHVTAPAALAQMEAIAGTHYQAEPMRTTALTNLPGWSRDLLRCSVHEYRMAAAEYSHVLFHDRLMPWDHAAGWLLHQEAGGSSAHVDGWPYLPSRTTGGLICGGQTKLAACERGRLGTHVIGRPDGCTPDRFPSATSHGRRNRCRKAPWHNYRNAG